MSSSGMRIKALVESKWAWTGYMLNSKLHFLPFICSPDTMKLPAKCISDVLAVPEFECGGHYVRDIIRSLDTIGKTTVHFDGTLVLPRAGEGKEEKPVLFCSFHYGENNNSMKKALVSSHHISLFGTAKSNLVLEVGSHMRSALLALHACNATQKVRLFHKGRLINQEFPVHEKPWR